MYHIFQTTIRNDFGIFHHKKMINVWAVSMAQEIEHLPSKHKTLSSNPVLPKKKRKMINIEEIDMLNLI
jgi:hypothetical protein